MGWSYGINFAGREVGYGVEAICDLEGCDEKIDRGLAYCCGSLAGVEGDPRYCGGYYCPDHLFYGRGDELDEQACEACLNNAEEEEDE